MFASNKSAAPSNGKLFVEDVFSTYLYTGTSSAQTITNGIDLAGKGGLVWQKRRDAATDHYLFDTARGGVVSLASNSTSTGTNWGAFGLTYNSNGFTILSGFSTSATFASWTFRKAPKFFDVVTYTGDGTAARNIAHNLGSRPHCVIIKRTDTTENWKVGFRDGALNFYQLQLNTNDAANTATTYTGGYGYGIASGANVNTHFTVEAYGGSVSAVNASGATYVAYLFAHDTTSDGIIQCGSYTGTGSLQSINLGWEPQWVLIKKTDSANSWIIHDNMRGMSYGGNNLLLANTADAEFSASQLVPTATGFNLTGSSAGWNTSAATYIYIAIRRGPMRTPTSGTSVFSPLTANNSGGTINTIGFPLDMQIAAFRTDGSKFIFDRLRGVNSTQSTTVATPYLMPSSTSAEQTLTDFTRGVSNTGFMTTTQTASTDNVYWNFRRAPSFFDEVCYTGTGVDGRIIYHNLGVPPELIITKGRNNSWNWCVYHTALGAYGSNASYTLILNTTDSLQTSGAYKTDSLTATQYKVSPDEKVNQSGYNFVAYLFASCPGVSKVGSYTGNGSSQTINCGFAAGARFVLIKRTDSTGDWYVFDTARGMTTLTDPYMLMNSAAAETATIGAVTTTSVGFSVNASILAAINTSGANYIFLAVA